MHTKEAPRPPLRTRIREAGGLYLWLNTSLIKLAGPAQLGEGIGTVCYHCGARKGDHLDQDGALICPERGDDNR